MFSSTIAAAVLAFVATTSVFAQVTPFDCTPGTTTGIDDRGDGGYFGCRTTSEIPTLGSNGINTANLQFVDNFPADGTAVDCLNGCKVTTKFAPNVAIAGIYAPSFGLCICLEAAPGNPGMDTRTNPGITGLTPFAIEGIQQTIGGKVSECIPGVDNGAIAITDYVAGGTSGVNTLYCACGAGRQYPSDGSTTGCVYSGASQRSRARRQLRPQARLF